MLEFLEDCQLHLKICGYCATENLPRFRWSALANRCLSFLFVYFVGTSIARQLRDERIRSFIQMVAVLEQTVAHFTLTAQKSKILEFFRYFDVVANQSKFVTFQKRFAGQCKFHFLFLLLL